MPRLVAILPIDLSPRTRVRVGEQFEVSEHLAGKYRVRRQARDATDEEIAAAEPVAGVIEVALKPATPPPADKPPRRPKAKA